MKPGWFVRDILARKRQREQQPARVLPFTKPLGLPIFDYADQREAEVLAEDAMHNENAWLYQALEQLYRGDLSPMIFVWLIYNRGQNLLESIERAAREESEADMYGDGA